MNKKYLWILPVIIVLAAIILGVYFAGSPRVARATRMDERRVQDLGSLQSTVNYYWQNQKKLPETLDEIDTAGKKLPTYSDFSYFVPRDPVSGKRYDYKKVDEDTFEVCAQFDSEKDYTTNQPFYDPYGRGPIDWSHEAGYKCFPYTVSTTTITY